MPYKDTTQAERAAGVTPVDYQYPELHVERYNAGSDRIAIVTAFQVANERGGGVIEFLAKKDYDLGDFFRTETVVPITGLSGLTINGNGARLVGNTTGNFQPCYLNFINCSNVTVNDLRARDDGADLSVVLPGNTLRGAWFLYFKGSGAPAKYGGITISNCHAEDMVMFFSAGEAGAARVDRIYIEPSCSAKNVFYGVALRNNGDNVSGGLDCWNPRRAFMAYGVDNVTFETRVFFDSNAIPADTVHYVLCYASGYPTRNIKLRAAISGDLSSFLDYSAIAFEFQTEVGDNGLIEDVDAELSVHNVTAGNIRPFRFSSYSNGVAQTTTTDNVWKHIRIGGQLQKNVAQTDAPETFVPIYATVSPTTECDIILSESLAKSWAPITFANNFMLKTAADRETRFVSGDLAGKTVAISLAGLDQQNFALKLNVWADDNYDSLTPQNSTYEERLIAGRNAAGAVTIEHNTLLARIEHGTASTFAYAASGGNISVTFNTYSNAKARARVDAQFTLER